MNNFRISVLVFLALALVALVIIQINLNSRLELALMQANTSLTTPTPAQNTTSPHFIVPNQTPTAPGQAAVVVDPVQAEELAHAKAEQQRLQKELDDLRRRQAVAEEEKMLLERKVTEQGDPQLKWLNDLQNAELVGRVTEYHREANLLIFQAIGQPSISIGQELAIRRRAGIFAYIVVDGVDSENKIFHALVKRNELFDKNINEPLKPGDDIIIPPTGMQSKMENLATPLMLPSAPANNKTSVPDNKKSAEPVVVPWET
ncbi:MAG: hypothetical protein Q4C05_01090 [Akkermansia sp.]|nr:hypothetical protein [Akkermansia sp.]